MLDMIGFSFSDTGELIPIGAFDAVFSYSYKRSLGDIGTFMIKMPITEYNVAMADICEFIHLENGFCGKVDYTSKSLQKRDNTLLIKGNLSEKVLCERYIYPVFENASSKASATCKALIDANCAGDRAIAYFDFSQIDLGLGSVQSNQIIGGTVLDSILDICSADSLGVHGLYDSISNKIVFNVFSGINRSSSQSIISPVILSTGIGDILGAKYEKDLTDFYNVALVAGATDDSGRKTLVVYLDDVEPESFNRREFFVDAKSVSLKKANGTAYTDSEYNALLLQKGKEALAKHCKSMTYLPIVKDYGATFCFEKDYFIGDTISIQDTNFGISIDAVVTGATITYDADGKTVEPILGFQKTTLANILRRLQT